MNQNMKEEIKEILYDKAVLERKTKREVKEILYDKDKIECEELVNKIMNKSHLIIIIECEEEKEVKEINEKCFSFAIKEDNWDGLKEKYIIYVEEIISYYDNYISHLNTNSFIIDNDNRKHKSEGILIGSKWNDILFSFKCHKKEREYEIKVNKEGKIFIPKCTEIIPEFIVKDKFEIKECLTTNIKVIEMKETEDEIEKKNMIKEVNKLDSYSMMIISKYLNQLNDYINIEKSCKEYRGIVEQFKYNPIAFKNEKEREILKSVETYNYYEREINKEEKEITTNDENIKKYVYWNVTYSYWKDIKKEENEFKNIEYGKEDMKKHLCVQEIGEGYDKKIYLKSEKVELKKGITSIGKECFEYCVRLKEITIPSTVTSIGNSCFHKCPKLNSVNIPLSVKSIGDCCFSSCKKLSRIDIPTSVTSLGDNCFSSCSQLSTINIPSSVTSIGKNCFGYCCNLRIINIPTTISSIGDYWFHQCFNLRTINIPTTISKIGNCSFKGCYHLHSMNIPLSVSELGPFCFSECSSLSEINIPSNISYIGNGCFYRCPNLILINVPLNVSCVEEFCFEPCSDLSLSRSVPQ